MEWRAILGAVMIGAPLVGCLLAAVPAAGAGASLYVSPEGNDGWSGRTPAPNKARTNGPFRTLARAAKAAGPGDTCFIREGVYNEILRPARSGTGRNPITFRNFWNETPVISGADPVTGWKREEDGVYSAPVGWDLGHQNQVFAGGHDGGTMLTEARWPTNTGTLLKPVRARVQSGTGTTITDPKLPGGENAWKGALLWCAGGSEWICWTARVTAYNARTHTLTFDQEKKKWYRPRKGNP
ncbi:MAG: hypothetical protein ACYSU0_09505, partial [Planctomycetota bacterium]